MHNFFKNFDAKLELDLMRICPKKHQKSGKSASMQKINENKVPKRCWNINRVESSKFTLVVFRGNCTHIKKVSQKNFFKDF